MYVCSKVVSKLLLYSNGISNFFRIYWYEGTLILLIIASYASSSADAKSNLAIALALPRPGLEGLL
jgi:hypothetical protein